jgi:4-hydroxy-tetrahydrodipicolinate synthase
VAFVARVPLCRARILTVSYSGRAKPMTEHASGAWTWDDVLCGVVPPLISPLDPAGEPDAPALAALVDHVLAAGCRGLFVLGGCGEGAWLTARQREAVVRAAVRAAAGRAPVLAGVMLPATGPAAEAARQAEAAGANAIVGGSPYYVTVDAAAQRRHVEAVLGAVRVPLLLYNIPQATHHRLAPETVAALAQEARVLGLKDSAGDFEAFQRLLLIKLDRPRFRVLQGNEPLSAASLLQGGDGLVPGLANVAPGMFVKLCHAAAERDTVAATQLQAEIEDLAALYAQGHWLASLKGACALLGIGTGAPAPPLVPANDEERRVLQAILVRHGLVPAVDTAPYLSERRAPSQSPPECR